MADEANTALDLMIAEAATVLTVVVTAMAGHAGVTALEVLQEIIGRLRGEVA